MIFKLIFNNQVLRNASCFTRNITVSAPCAASSKVYELRKYLIRPSEVGKFTKLSTEHFYLRTKVSKLSGYWTSEIGSNLNQAIHIWEYDNLQHRATARATLAKDQAWLSDYVAPIFPLFVQQENCLMYMPQWCNEMTDHNKKNGVYELDKFEMKAGGPSVWETSLQSLFDAKVNLGGSDLIGVWFTEIGDLNTVHAVWRFDDYAARSMNKAKARSSKVVAQKEGDVVQHLIKQSTVLMLPTAWSTLQ